MMEERLRLGSALLNSKGLLMTSCDEHELDRLRLCLTNLGVLSGFMTTLVWKARNFTDTRSLTGISLDHEYILGCGATPTGRFKGQPSSALICTMNSRTLGRVKSINVRRLLVGFVQRIRCSDT